MTERCEPTVLVLLPVAFSRRRLFLEPVVTDVRQAATGVPLGNARSCAAKYSSAMASRRTIKVSAAERAFVRWAPSVPNGRGHLRRAQMSACREGEGASAREYNDERPRLTEWFDA